MTDISGTMVERVSSAVMRELQFQADGTRDGPHWQCKPGTTELDFIDQNNVDMHAVARAAIAAMRTPTEAMINAAIRNAPSFYDIDVEDRDAWARLLRASIDAALGDQS